MQRQFLQLKNLLLMWESNRKETIIKERCGSLCVGTKRKVTSKKKMEL